jgi:hypothetical protein
MERVRSLPRSESLCSTPHLAGVSAEQPLAMLEWIELSPEIIVIATRTGAMRHVPRRFGSDPFLAPMSGPGHPETTHWLFEGAMAAAGWAARRAAPVAEGAHPRTPRRITREGWAYRLCGYYHSTRATRRLLPDVERRFTESGRRSLASWTRQKIDEEAGHDVLALRDLAALGYDGEKLAEVVFPPRSAAWVAQFEAIAGSPDPVECVGYAHGLERLALLRGAEEISEIEAALPGVKATRCLRVHSRLGSDREHVAVNVNVTAALSAAERRRIVRACHRTAEIFFDRAFDRPPDQSALEAQFSRFTKHTRAGVIAAQ